jgi:hypothetical protein
MVEKMSPAERRLIKKKQQELMALHEYAQNAAASSPRKWRSRTAKALADLAKHKLQKIKELLNEDEP